MTCCHFILSSHPAGGGTWAMTGYCSNVWDLLTSVNNSDHCIRMAYVDHPDVLCEPFGWYVYKCRLIFLEVVRKSVPCVLYRKIRMRVTRMTISVMCHCKMRATCHCNMRATCHCKMRATCHCKMRATCSQREGSLHATYEFHHHEKCHSIYLQRTMKNVLHSK